jgi:hypothetical protein
MKGGEGITPFFLSDKGFTARKRGFMKGFEKKIRGVAVFWSGSSFLLFPDPIHAKSALEAVELGFALSERVGKELEAWFPGLELFCRAEVCRQQLALKGGVTKWIPDKFSFQGERLIIDFSTGEAEIETFGKFSVEGMLNVAEFLDEVAKGPGRKWPEAGERLDIT